MKDERDELVMSPSELRAASSKLGCLIAAERGIPASKVGKAYGVSARKMSRMMNEWREASATVWPKWG